MWNILIYDNYDKNVMATIAHKVMWFITITIKDNGNSPKKITNNIHSNIRDVVYNNHDKDTKQLKALSL